MIKPTINFKIRLSNISMMVHVSAMIKAFVKARDCAKCFKFIFSGLMLYAFSK